MEGNECTENIVTGEMVDIENRKDKESKSDNVGAKNMFMWQSRGISVGANMMVQGYLLVYCTAILGMSPALVGTLIMVSRIVDAITDLTVGYLVDKTNTRWGRGRPYEWGVIGMWVCTVLLFAAPEGFSPFLQAAWVFFMFVMVNAIFVSLLNAGNTVYMVRAFNNEKKYIAISTYGSIIVMLGVVAVNVSLPMLVDNIAVDAAGWRTVILIYAIPMALIGMLRFFFIKEEHKVDAKTENKLNMKDVGFALKNNHSVFIISLLALTITLVGNIGAMGLGQLYFIYIVGDLSLMGILGLIQIVLLPLAFIFPMFIRKFSIKALIMSGLVLAAMGGVVNFFALDNFGLLVAGALLRGIGNVPAAMLAGLLVIQCAEYNEWKKMPRLEGTISNITALFGKIGSALGVFMVGVLLSASGYVADAGAISDSATMMLRLLFGLIPTGLYMLTFFVVSFYKLEKQMPQIKADNEAARAEAGIEN